MEQVKAKKKVNRKKRNRDKIKFQLKDFETRTVFLQRKYAWNFSSSYCCE